MTREEAKLHLMDIINDWDNPNTSSEVIDSLTMAIKALEQEEQEQYYKDLAQGYERVIIKLIEAITERG